MTRWVQGCAAIVLLVAACSPVSPTSSATPGAAGNGTDQVLRLRYVEGPLDPHDPPFDGTVQMLVSGLVGFDEDLNTVPALAESWDVTEDGRHITFHLREASYSNGDPIVAADFVYGWRRLLDPRAPSLFAYLLADLAGAADLLALPANALPDDEVIDNLLDGLGVSAPDQRTLEVDLARRAAYFVAVVTHYATAPILETWITQPGATEAGAYVSSGPYQLTEWVHDERRELEPNPMWWGEPSTLSRIEMRTFASDNDAVDAYRRGELDILALADDMDMDGTDLADQARPLPRSDVAYLTFDFMKADSPTTANRDLRQALSLSVDQEALREVMRWGGQAAGSVIPPGMPGHDASLEATFDPAAARSSLDRALADLGLASPDQLRLSMVYPDWWETSPEGAGYLTAQWRSLLGIEVETVLLEGDNFSQYIAHDHDMLWEGWLVDYPHQQAYLEPLYACHSSFNSGGYCNPAVDELLEAAAGTADVEEQGVRYLDAQRLVVDDLARLFLGWPNGSALVAPWVEGLVLTTMDLAPGSRFLHQVSIAPHD